VIIQNLLDFLSTVFAGLISLIPPLPPEAAQAVGMIEDGTSYVLAAVEPMGVIFPFDAFAIVVAGYVGCFYFWASMLVVRVVLWAVGR